MQYPARIRALALVPCLWTAAMAGGETAPAQYAMFRGGPAHSGVYDTKAVHHYQNVQWAFATRGPVRSAPALADSAVYFGSGDGHIYALERESGTLRWAFRTGGAVHSSPALADGALYATSRDGGLYSLDRTNGDLRWRFETGERVAHPWGYDWYLSSPTVVDGVVYFGSGDGHVYAVTAGGRLQWKYRTGGRVRSSPAYHRGTIYVGSMDGHVYALDSRTGRRKWRFATDGASREMSRRFNYDGTSVKSSPAIAQGLVLFGAHDGKLYAVDLETGQERWRHSHGTSWVNSSPAVYNGLVLAGSSDAAFFNAVDLRTGAERWRFNGQVVQSSAAVADGAAYFGAYSQDRTAGFLLALDAMTGGEQWRFVAPEAVLATPVVAAGVVYIGCDDGRLYALAGETTKRRGFVAPRKAVYPSAGPADPGASQQALFKRFRAEGYQVLDEESLGAFFRRRLVDRIPSVVVFAADRVSPAVVDTGAGAPLLRQYLDAHGKIVWPGPPPFAAGRGRTSVAKRVLGVSAAGLDPAVYGVAVTETGREWGLTDGWIGAWAVDAGEVSAALATDEFGRAAAWVKNFGGPEGSGFVRLGGRRQTPSELDQVKAAAEYGLEPVAGHAVAGRLIEKIGGPGGSPLAPALVAAALDLAAAMEDEDLLDALAAVLRQDPDPQDRLLIVAQADELGHAHSLGLLIDALEDENGEVMLRALRALRRLRTHIGDRDRERVRARVGRLARDARKTVRDEAAVLVEDFVGASCDRARAAALEGDRGRALDLLRQALAYAPDSKQAQYHMGRMLVQGPERSRGIEWLRRHGMAAEVAFFAREPELDGRLDDEAWQRAEPVAVRYLFDREHAAAFAATTRASFRLGYTRGALFVGFHARDEHPDSLIARTTEMDGRIWSDDIASLMLDAGFDGAGYAHIGINSTGAVADAWHAKDISTQDLSWNAKIKVATHVGADFWSLEYRVEFEERKLPRPARGDIWGANLVRAYRGREYNQWMPSYGPNIHQPDDFGLLLFQ